MNTQTPISQSKESLSFDEREEIISHYSLFALLNRKDIRELALIAREVKLDAGALITKEGDIVDSVYLIVSGSAKVTRSTKSVQKTVILDLATLKEGDAIGLTGTGFFARRGVRTATVTALQPMTLLAFDVIDFQRLLQTPGLASSALKNTGDKILLMNFIRQSNLFKDFSVDRIGWLAKNVKKISLKSGATLYKEGDKSDEFYFVVTGCVSIASDLDKSRIVRLYESNSVIGLDTFMNKANRNALAKAESDSELFVIDRKIIADAKNWQPSFFENIMNMLTARFGNLW